jgi:hypothetical protein
MRVVSEDVAVVVVGSVKPLMEVIRLVDDEYAGVKLNGLPDLLMLPKAS